MQSAGISKVNTKKVTPFTYRPIKDDYLVANDFGEWTFLNSADFKAYVEGALKSGNPVFDQLRSKNFLMDDLDEKAAQKRLEARYKNLNYGPKLHILSLNREAVKNTDPDEEDVPAKKMDKDVAERAIDLAFMSTSPELSFAFRGESPLGDWELFSYAVEYAQNRNKIAFKKISFSVETEASELDDEKITYLANNDISVGIFFNKDSFKKSSAQSKACKTMVSSIEASPNKEASTIALISCSPDLMTKAKSIVNHCSELGIGSIKLITHDIRNLTATNNGETECSEEAFRAFYGEFLDHLMEAGISEENTSGYLRRIFAADTPDTFELSSPAMDGSSQLAYDVDGYIYTSDVGRVLLEQRSDPIFLIGHVTRTSYQDLVLHPTVRALILATTVEAQPGWVNSAYKHYAGKSPTMSYLEHGSIQGRMIDSASTQLQFAILDTLFERLNGADESYLEKTQSLAGLE